MSYPISDVTRRVVYSGSAGTGPYSFTFEVLANTDIAVYKNTTLLTLTTDYTVTINSNGTGSVTLVSAATGSDNITLVGNRSIERATDFVTGGDLFANTLNDEFDSLVIFAQQIKEEAARGLKAPITDPTDVNMVLPIKSSRKGKVLAFDSTTGDPVNGPALDSMVTVIEQSDNINTVADSIADVNTVAADIADVSTVAGIAGNVTTVAGIAANVTTVAGIDTEVTTVAGISANVTTVAGISSAVSTVAANITDIQNAEENADAAATSASAASTSATNAASSASAASTSASNASSSASAASTSASNASSSATAAASSAAAAAASLDSFDDRYLGAKSSDPTLDNDGNALVTGALYYNTTSQTMKVYDGANWITATAAGTTSMLVYKYVATAGQTTFSGAATVGGTMSYTSGNIIVFLNGAALDSTDYTATNGTSVVLGSAASLNDEVVIVAFKSFTVADTYTKGEVDAFAVKLTGDQAVAGIKTFTSKAVIEGLTVGKGAGSVSNNTAVGAGALGANVGGQSITAIGYNALKLNTLASGYANNTSVGAYSMQATTSGIDNTALGTEAMYSTTTGSTNVSVGKGSLNANTTGSNNTAVGYQAGNNLTTGTNNVYVGITNASSASASYELNIAAASVPVGGKGSNTGLLTVYNGSTNGSIYQGNNSASWATTSDKRLKKNIVDNNIGLEVINLVRVRNFEYRLPEEIDAELNPSDAVKNAGVQLGVIAQEFQQVLPDCVKQESTGVLSVDTDNLTWYMINAIKELKANLDATKTELAALKGQL